ncbi:hypothetical protein BLNAU_4544 [Blattamonas nauphoetae]|uniref:Uncharacterized protein n=1 Tax=Blattamonas nauphoetae TaxID=2049346 RepID=A0ABQ9Y994_9EUKA|nr:hypothetical protein BLNAU_4544 [Blattamonas nauphoetae]
MVVVSEFLSLHLFISHSKGIFDTLCPQNAILPFVFFPLLFSRSPLVFISPLFAFTTLSVVEVRQFPSQSFAFFHHFSFLLPFLLQDRVPVLVLVLLLSFMFLFNFTAFSLPHFSFFFLRLERLLPALCLCFEHVLCLFISLSDLLRALCSEIRNLFLRLIQLCFQFVPLPFILSSPLFVSLVPIQTRILKLVLEVFVSVTFLIEQICELIFECLDPFFSPLLNLLDSRSFSLCLFFVFSLFFFGSFRSFFFVGLSQLVDFLPPSLVHVFHCAFSFFFCLPFLSFVRPSQILHHLLVFPSFLFSLQLLREARCVLRLLSLLLILRTGLL